MYKMRSIFPFYYPYPHTPSSVTHFALVISTMFSKQGALGLVLPVLFATRSVAAEPMADAEPEIELIKRQNLATVYSHCTTVSL